MSNIDDLNSIIEDQMVANEDKSLFFEGERIFTISEKMYNLFVHNFEKIHNLLLNDDEQINRLISNTVEKTMKIFQNSNQYISFRDKDKAILQTMYKNMLMKFEREYLNKGTITEKEIYKYFNEHHKNLKKFLKITNGENLFEKYRLNKNIPLVICEEYTAKLQIEILGLDVENLQEPIIDVGCGKDFRLVKLLREKGYKAYGLDRIESKEEFIIKSNWMDYMFEEKKWGTIISHMAFSNHFNHHHFRKDGKYVDFMKKYVEMLKSLKLNGVLTYSPGIEVVEEIIKSHYKDAYRLEKNDLSTKIMRVR